jgi:signal transduction histidine kinase
MELSVTEFDLPAAVQNAVTFVRERAARHGLKLEVKIDERLGEFRADERKLKQVLVNLLSNAVKFTPPGGTVTLGAEKLDECVLISVADTGIGIAPEHQELIFEEFRQVSSGGNKKPEGTGLGLALTRRFVEMHAGRISVKSEPGKGAIFALTLPITQTSQ